MAGNEGGQRRPDQAPLVRTLAMDSGRADSPYLPDPLADRGQVSANRAVPCAGVAAGGLLPEKTGRGSRFGRGARQNGSKAESGVGDRAGEAAGVDWGAARALLPPPAPSLLGPDA
jgi:hypothetical protein